MRMDAAWYSPGGYRLIVQPNRAMAKGYQVRQFLRQYHQETEDKKGNYIFANPNLSCYIYIGLTQSPLEYEVL